MPRQPTGPTSAHCPLFFSFFFFPSPFFVSEALNASSAFRPYLCSLPPQVPLPLFLSKAQYADVRASLPQVRVCVCVCVGETYLAKMIFSFFFFFTPQSQQRKFDTLVEARRDVIELHYMSLMPTLYRDYPQVFPTARRRTRESLRPHTLVA